MQKNMRIINLNGPVPGAAETLQDCPSPSPSFPELPAVPDLKSLDEAALRRLLDELQTLYDRVLMLEPEEDDENYDLWEERLEEIDDLTDDILDAMEDRKQKDRK